MQWRACLRIEQSRWKSAPELRERERKEKKTIDERVCCCCCVTQKEIKHGRLERVVFASGVEWLHECSASSRTGRLSARYPVGCRGRFARSFRFQTGGAFSSCGHDAVHGRRDAVKDEQLRRAGEEQFRLFQQ